jgi:SAM-dependent methyltransferase
MKKDYVKADAALHSEEAQFVEDFWTRRWEAQAELPDPAAVAAREEYRLMRPYLSSLPEGARLLDGGCGMGEWTVFLAGQGFQVAGLDLSQRTIERLQAHYPGQEFVRGDIRDTGFAADSFDAYFSWGAFEHFEAGPGECIAEAYRLLKPGGLLCISVPYQNWRHILREARRRYRWHEAFNFTPGAPGDWRFYQWRFTPADLRQELEMRGFTVLNFAPLHREEGLRRAIIWDLGLKPGSRLFRWVERLLLRVIPGRLAAHMLFAAARKVSDQ